MNAVVVRASFVWRYGGRTYNLALDLHADAYERLAASGGAITT